MGTRTRLGAPTLAVALLAGSTVAIGTTTQVASAAGPITFSEFTGTITDQYADLGIVFTTEVFITGDVSNPTSPVLSGTPLYSGPISARFIVPGADPEEPGVVDEVIMDAGYFNEVGSTRLTAFDIDGNVVDTVLNTNGDGIESMSVSGDDIASFTIALEGADAAGYAIDNLVFTDPVPLEEEDVEVCIFEGDDAAVGLPSLQFGSRELASGIPEFATTDDGGCLQWDELEEDDEWSSISLGLPPRIRDAIGGDELTEIDEALAAGDHETALLHPGIRPLLPYLERFTFDEFPDGTVVDDEYVDRGVRFSGGAVIDSDTGFESTPVLTTPDGMSPIEGRFVRLNDDLTEDPVIQSLFSLDIGILNERASVQVTTFDLDGEELASKTTRFRGIQSLTVWSPGTHRFVIDLAPEDPDPEPTRRDRRTRNQAREPGGFAIDNLAFGLPGQSTFIDVCVTRDGDPEVGVPVDLLTIRRGTESEVTEGDGCARFSGARLYLAIVNR